MQFTQEQKNQYLDKLANRTQEGIWMTEMALMKHTERLAKKKALLTVIEGKLEKKECQKPVMVRMRKLTLKLKSLI
jgi:hypothetical protein